MTKKPTAKAPPLDNVGASWDRYRPKPKLCPICKKRNCKVGAKTCRDPECAAEYDRRYNRGHYEKNAEKILANQKARLGSRATPPIVKYCEAPHPTKPGELCNNKFEAKGRGKATLNVCSSDCRRRLRNAQQRDRYHADPQAKQDYKNAYYAANYAHELVTKRCPYCGTEFKTKRHNQQTCGKPQCIQRIYETTARKEINARKREKRRANPAYAAHDQAYQRNYRKANPERFKGYREKRGGAAYTRKWRAAARQAAIAAGTFVDRRRKLTDSQKAKIVKQRRAGKTLKQIAESFGIHFATVARICDTH